MPHLHPYMNQRARQLILGEKDVPILMAGQSLEDELTEVVRPVFEHYSPGISNDIVVHELVAVSSMPRVDFSLIVGAYFDPERNINLLHIENDIGVGIARLYPSLTTEAQVTLLGR